MVEGDETEQVQSDSKRVSVAEYQQDWLLWQTVTESFFTSGSFGQARVSIWYFSDPFTVF